MQAAPFAYITNAGDAPVAVIDTASNSVVATIQVGSSPVAFGQFISPGAAPAPTPIPALSPLGQALCVCVLFVTGLLVLRRRLSPAS